VRNAEFEIDGYRFGCSHPVDVLGWDLGAREVRVQDTPRPGAPGLMLGRDFDDPPEWTFTFRARNDQSAEVAFDEIETFRRVWQASQGVGEVSALRYGLPGRERVVFGRPRRWSLDDDAIRQGIHIGRLAGLATFQLSDVRSFSDVVSEVSLGLVPESSGGLVFPLVFPVTTTVTGGVRAGFVENLGSAPAPVTVTFKGPVKNPRIYTDEWEIGITGNLAYDETVTVDALALSVVNQAGANVGGRLTRGTRLRDAALVPGQSEIRFTGGDSTGTARATVSWRDASYGI